MRILTGKRILPARLRAGGLLPVVTLILFAATPLRADIFSTEKFSLYGDFRLRAETDWDSQTATGIERDDRTRIRVRMRVGFVFNPTEHWQVGARIRSGQETSQQSPHLTILDFQDNEQGDIHFNFDRWYLRGKGAGFEAWAGRNTLPFWKQDELLFDDDVTMPGVAVSWGTEAGPGRLALAGGYFALPSGMTQTSGNMAGGQVAWLPQFDGVKLAFAGGAYLFDANPMDIDGFLLLQGNGQRDYRILSASFQARWDAGGRPLVLGADVMRNIKDYDPNDGDPVTAANHDQTHGYVLLGTYGSLSDKGNWLVGYYYAHLETFSVNNSFSQDDWVRWGTLAQTRASDMKGHEFRFGWAFNGKMNLLARLYLVEAITSDEDGNRFRIDFNYKL